MAKYTVNDAALTHAHDLIAARRYVLRSRWGDVQPSAADGTRYLRTHTWEEYGAWHLGLTEGAAEETKRRYAFVFGDFRRLHRMGIIACHYRAAEWGHKDIELAAHDLLQHFDRSVDVSGRSNRRSGPRARRASADPASRTRGSGGTAPS